MTYDFRAVGWETGLAVEWGSISAAASVSSSAAHTGTYGLRISPSGATSHSVSLHDTVNHAQHVGFWFRYPNSLPSADHAIFLTPERVPSADTLIEVMFRDSDNTVVVNGRQTGTILGTIEGFPVSVGNWYYIELLIYGAAPTGDPQFTVWMAEDGDAEATDLGTFSSGSLGGSYNEMTLGVNQVKTFEIDIDDFFREATDDSANFADVVAACPTYCKRLEALFPDGVGTHNEAGEFTASTGTLADSWQLIDDAPPWTAALPGDNIAQTTTGTAKYLEYTVEDLTLGAGEDIAGCVLHGWVATTSALGNVFRPQGVVQGVATGFGIGGGINANGLWLRTGINIFHATTDVYGQWTEDDVNSLMMRFGYSSDVSPIPRLAAFFVYAVVGVGGLSGAYWGIAAQPG